MPSDGPGPETSFQDLANLGWPKQQIFDTLNSVRSGTMSDISDLHLNDGFCQQWGWYSYNVTIGNLIPQSNIPTNITSTETVWSYDNSKNNQPFTTTWNEIWVQTTTASVSVTTSASVSLSASFNIPDIGGTSLSVSISSSATTAQTATDSHQLGNTWTITVGPYETMLIDRITTTTSQEVLYSQKYGIADGTQGLIASKWNDHYYWAFCINHYLTDESGNPPTGTLVLTGTGQKQSFDHKIIRKKAGNQGTNSRSVANVIAVSDKKVLIAIPGRRK
ncbi:hypothetical protein M413DRAFT_408377 [Hebeloma cylindrosporum]|uniref:Uncharacterized protein n=1 Tax=Hebeloma cylindrosporum TaxID=76867 RepID=A0A0C3CE86_HEBCY|nr:hypothetical protein M413DRAFT_408377 [Hebeloma cylindrosporum h7]